MSTKTQAQVIVGILGETRDWCELSDVCLGDLILHLKSLPPDATFIVGFREACSYRGYYEQLAFVCDDNVTAAEMLLVAENAVGAEFYGYKGGDYTMDIHTPCHLVTEPSATGFPMPLSLFKTDRWHANYIPPPDPPRPEEQIEAVLAKYLDTSLMRMQPEADRGDLASDLAEWFRIITDGAA